MAANHRVTATLLNLRATPHIRPDNVIATLHHHQAVDVAEHMDGSWAKVQAAVTGRNVEGYVARRYLEPLPASAPKPGPAPIPQAVRLQVHYAPHSESRLDSTARRHCPLSVPSSVRTSVKLEGADSSQRRTDKLSEIIRMLDVQNSIRYSPQKTVVAGVQKVTQTYCNIYAYDYCYLAGAFLPRVWWRAKALQQVLAGETVPVQYANTVDELNANSIHDWFLEWGDDVGWKRSFDMNELQNIVNEGAVGVIIAQRSDLSRSGHVVAVVPETDGQSALRNGRSVASPLQSQAGVVNKKYFSQVWWQRMTGSTPVFRSYAFWYHAP